VCVERAALVQQLLGEAERLRRREHQIVRDALLPGRAAREWPAKGVTWPRVAGAPGRITVAPCGGGLLRPAHRSGSGSASQVCRAESNLSGCSSGRK